jgi:hypothetical protein
MTGWEDGSLWTASNATLTDDYAHYRVYTRGKKIQIAGAVTAMAKVTPPAEDSPSKLPPWQCVSAWLWVSDASKVSQISLELWGDASGSAANRYSVTLAPNSACGTTLSDGWNALRVHALTDSLKVVKALIPQASYYAARLVIVTTGSVDVTVGHVYLECAKRARIAFVFDACYATAFTPGGIYDQLRARKLPVTLATCPGIMGATYPSNPAADIISWDALAQYARENGNDVSWHSYSKDSESSATAAQITANAIRSLEALARHGHKPVWRAAWLSNQVSANRTALQQLVLAYATGAGTSGPDAWPPISPWNIPRFGIHMGTYYNWSGTCGTSGITLSSSYDVQVGDLLLVAWDNNTKLRRDCTVTSVNGQLITVSGGTGDTIPTDGSSCVVRDFTYWQRHMAPYWNAIDAHRPFVCFYTHGYTALDHPTLANDLSGWCMNKFLEQVDARIAAGTLEFVTIPQLLLRGGARPGRTFSGSPAWWLNDALSDPPEMNNTDNEIGGLTFSSSYTQAEVETLRDKCEELADDVRALRNTVLALTQASEQKKGNLP